jgi:hypothetical protein
VNLFDLPADTPLRVTVRPNLIRLAAACFPHPKGLIFADIGWPEATINPWHLLEGTLTGEGPWTIGDSTIEEIDHGDPEASEWNAWMTYRRSPEGQWATPERARQMMQDEGLFDA